MRRQSTPTPRPSRAAMTVPMQHSEPGVDPELGRQDARSVGADAGKGGVSKGDLAGVAGQQVPAGGHHHVEEADDHDVKVVDIQSERQETQESRGHQKDKVETFVRHQESLTSLLARLLFGQRGRTAG